MKSRKAIAGGCFCLKMSGRFGSDHQAGQAEHDQEREIHQAEVHVNPADPGVHVRPVYKTARRGALKG